MNIQDNFPERIEFVIDKLKGPSEFARKTGVTLSTIARWRKGEAEPSRPNLIKIAEVAEVNLEWLAAGTGKINETQNTKIDKQVKLLGNQLDNDDFEYIADYRSVKISAGLGALNEEQPPAYTKVEKSWLQARGLKSCHCAMFRVSGDSMYPTLKDEEEIIVDRSKTELNEGKIFILNHQGTMWVKKVQIDFHGIDLISDNPIYKPISLSAEEANSLIVIGQLVRGYRDF